jgi:hypothetical protein
MSSARRRAVRAVLATLAGGGLTAASLAGPLSDAAFGTGPNGPRAETTPTTTTPAPTPPPEVEPPTSTGTQPTTSTPTPSPAPAPSSTSPEPSAPSTTTQQRSTSLPAPAPPKRPVVVLQRRQKPTPGSKASPTTTPTKKNASKKAGARNGAAKATGPNNVAVSPQAIAQAGALAALLASSDASAQALAFYRIPLFLLPIYKAAAVQYGVPWQILAAINEIETNYGTDQSVSSAGAVGWMQFMPSTWLQYGVDALNAGYADPYNPVDAIFAAARYLRAAGSATDLHAAILAYNHSEEYASSVLLRAKLISTYPKSVIATLTGLIDGRLPVTGKEVAWSPLPPLVTSSSSATAGASALPSSSSGPAHAGAAHANGSAGAPSPLSPTAAAAAARSASAAPPPLQSVDVTSAQGASVLAVEDGRVIQIGHSRTLGNFVVLRDVYGDVFTYAGLGSVARTYAPAKPPAAKVTSPGVEALSTHDPAPSQPATAGSQSPLTLTVKAPARKAAAGGRATNPSEGSEEAQAGRGKVRLFAHPGNPDARASAAVRAARLARASRTPSRLPLRSGAGVASGTVLGRVRVPHGAHSGHLRFAVRPAGDRGTIEPGPILANWAQLQAALHPQGATAANALLGATASDVFLHSKAELQRAVLADPGITLSACGRRDVAGGKVDRRLLAVLAFLSRSALTPTVGARCAQPVGSGSAATLDALDITAINGSPIAHHQGAGSITDLTIRTLLTLPGEFVPHQIVSLMRYPGAANTDAVSSAWDHIRVEFPPAEAGTALRPAATGNAHSAQSGGSAPAPRVTATTLSSTQWDQLLTRAGALPAPSVRTKPSSAAIPDPKKH